MTQILAKSSFFYIFYFYNFLPVRQSNYKLQSVKPSLEIIFISSASDFDRSIDLLNNRILRSRITSKRTNFFENKQKQIHLKTAKGFFLYKYSCYSGIELWPIYIMCPSLQNIFNWKWVNRLLFAKKGTLKSTKSTKERHIKPPSTISSKN